MGLENVGQQRSGEPVVLNDEESTPQIVFSHACTLGPIHGRGRPIWGYPQMETHC